MFKNNYSLSLLSLESWAAAKKLHASVAELPAAVRIPNQMPLAPSVTPRVVNKLNQRSCTDLLTFTLRVWKIPEKFIEEMKVVRTIDASNGICYPK